MLPYAAYLRIYEPVRALAEPDRSRWEGYAASTERPRRVNALDEEHSRSLRRLVRSAVVRSAPVPEEECLDAYVRRTEGELYVSPWQTRLRSWLSMERLAELAPPGLVADHDVRQVLGDFERWRERRVSIRPYILSSTWHVPVEWFVPFIPEERWLVLGHQRASSDSGRGTGAGGGLGPQAGRGSGAAVAAPVRTLLYVTSMVYARSRVARAVKILDAQHTQVSIFGRLDGLDRWLSEFDPGSLVELDYGGLVHLLDDQALCADQSVGEVRVALTGLERGEGELTLAMYSRLQARWRRIRAIQKAN